MSVTNADTKQEIKRAVCEAIDRALPDGPVVAMRFDVKLTNDGHVAKVILWPEIEYYAKPNRAGYKFT